MGRFLEVIKKNLSLSIIIAAAILHVLIVVFMSYTSHNIIQETMEQLVEREMAGIYLGIRNHLTKIEITVDNMSWVVRDDLGDPDAMYVKTRRLVENNPAILGSSITFIPDYYPQKGRWFEPYAVRRADGTVENLQLGSAEHDYTKSEFYVVPIETGRGHWCEPYRDNDGAKAMVTTYAVPVRDSNNKIVAVVDADLPISLLEGMVEEGKVYKSTQRFLISGKNHLLAGQDGPVFQMVLKQISDYSDKQGYFTLEDEEGRDLHVFYHPVGGMTDWVLISVLEDGEVFGKLRNVQLLLLFVVCVGLLLVGFVISRASRNLERLRQTNAEKERIASELHVASQIQQKMLPNGSMIYDNVEIFGKLVPAREVGGDLFDYIIRDEKLFFCIGDVCGKGTPAAMLMASIHSLLYAFTLHENNPARVVHALNEVASDGNEDCLFFTFFIGVLDLPTGRLRYCNAGHNAPFILGDELMMLDCDPNAPIGPIDDAEFSLQTITLSPGSTIFLYTDGLTEANNAEGQELGLERTKEVLNDCVKRRLKPEDIVSTVTEAVHRFAMGAEQSDDLTMLAVRYTPQKFESTMTETITLDNDLCEITRLSDFQVAVYPKMNVGKSLASKLRLAVEEAVVNVIKYAYPSGRHGSIHVAFMTDGRQLKITITDTGVSFDPTTIAKVDTSLSAKERKIGGLGIFLVREIMDSINYERVDDRNILTLTKKIEKE